LFAQARVCQPGISTAKRAESVSLSTLPLLASLGQGTANQEPCPAMNDEEPITAPGMRPQSTLASHSHCAGKLRAQRAVVRSVNRGFASSMEAIRITRSARNAR
jgi:hypothetical protein